MYTNLPRALDAFHSDEEDRYPREQQTEHDPPLESPRVLHGGGYVQRGAVPEEGSLTASLTLHYRRAVRVLGTIGPWQWTLQQRQSKVFIFYLSYCMSFI